MVMGPTPPGTGVMALATYKRRGQAELRNRCEGAGNLCVVKESSQAQVRRPCQPACGEGKQPGTGVMALATYERCGQAIADLSHQERVKGQGLHPLERGFQVGSCKELLYAARSCCSAAALAMPLPPPHLCWYQEILPVRPRGAPQDR